MWMDDVFQKQATELFQKEDYVSLCDILDNRFKINPSTNSPIDVSNLSIKTVGDLLDHMVLKVIQDVNEVNVKLTKHVFKALRNSLGFSSARQKYILENQSILLNSYKLLEFLNLRHQQTCIDCMKMTLQFLINLVVNNPPGSQKVWDDFRTIIKSLILNSVYTYYASALVYNIFRSDPTLAIKCNEIFEYVFDTCEENLDNEYLIFLREFFINDKELNYTYVNYKQEHRILCLEMMKNVFEEKTEIMNTNLISVLSSEFKMKSDCILKTVTDCLKDIEPYEVNLLLEILASISSNETCLKQLQTDKSLLINCAFLLKSVHSLGKLSENNFTPIGKLSELTNPDSECLNHPAFGFKAVLVRVLGNLSWRNKINQDKMRELDCIPLLLDCCNIDARNPFIIQWVVFAIRNLCDGNAENQKAIASMNREGVVSSAALHEMGLTLHNDGQNEIKIVPLDLKNKME